MTRSLVKLCTGIGLLAGAVVPDPGRAQDLTHPRDMELDGARFGIRDTTRFRFQLFNGLTGFLVPERAVPLVRLTAFVPAGSGDDEDRPGAAEAVALAMRAGPCWMGPDRFADELDAMAAALTVDLGRELLEVTLEVPVTDAERAVHLFSGILREPCLGENVLARFRRTGVTPPIRVGGPDRGSLALATDLFHRRLLADHPASPEISREAAADLDEDDLAWFHSRYVVPTNVVLAVSGMFEGRRLLDAVDQRFGDWAADRRLRMGNSPNVEVRDRLMIHHPSRRLQTWVVMGHELPRMRPRDVPALEVMNYILGGGHFDTRLFRETRDRRGLTNDASGFLEIGYRGPGIYSFRTYGRHEVTQQLIDIVSAEIERIRTELVSDEELFVAKGALIDGVYAMRFENGHAVARTFAETVARFGGFADLVAYPRRIDDVSAEDVRRAAQRYLHPERMQIVVVGPALTERRGGETQGSAAP